MITKGMMSSLTPEWSTPQDFFDSLDAEFHFTLDVCATDNNHKCPRYFTKQQDGLKQDWAGASCFCNPPYGRQISKWVAKASHYNVVALLPARTDTRWFHDHIYGKAEIRFIKGRLKFGSSKNSAPFPSMVVIWRPAPLETPL